MQTQNTNTERAHFTAEYVDVETFIAITLDKQIRTHIFVAGQPLTVDINRAELLAAFRRANVKQVRVDEYTATVYVLFAELPALSVQL